MPKLPSLDDLKGAIGGEPVNDPSFAMALMPMLDSFNHKSGAVNGCSFDPEANAFVLTAGAPLRRGEEAYISYGDKGNDALLQLFGFVEASNPHDSFLAVGLPEHVAAVARDSFRGGGGEAEVTRRVGLIDSLGLGPSLASAELTARGAPQGTWHALRLLLGSVEEVSGDLARLRGAVSLETEARCWAALRSYCKAARAAMGGARKADLAEARSTACPPRRALALQLRAEKKRLLSELEAALVAVESRSRKAGKPLSTVAMP